MSRNTFAAARAASYIRKMCLLAGLLTAGMVPASFGQDVYWIDDGTVIRRQTAAGVQDLVSSGHTIENLVLDTRAGQMYWSETREALIPPEVVHVTHTIRRANFDGSGAVDLFTEDGGTIYTLAGVGHFARYVRGLMLDVVENRLYWLLAATAVCRDCPKCTLLCNSPMLRSLQLDGSSPATVPGLLAGLDFTGTVTGSVAIDPRAGRIYWSKSINDAHPPYILSVNFDGSDLQQVLVELSLPDSGYSSAGVLAVALDHLSKKLYWIEVQGITRIIRRANPDGSAPETLVSYSAPSPGDEPAPLPIGLSVDPVCGRMFWAVIQTRWICFNLPYCLVPDGPGRIFGANLDGTQVEELVAGFGVATAVGFDPPDGDSDGSPDCEDACPSDPAKSAPGLCDCGQPDTDTDSDGTPDCQDESPNGQPDHPGDGGAGAAARALLSNCGIGAAGALGVAVLGLVSMRRRRRMRATEQ